MSWALVEIVRVTPDGSSTSQLAGSADQLAADVGELVQSWVESSCAGADPSELSLSIVPTERGSK